MTRVSRELLQDLTEQAVSPAVTIYLPTHRRSSPPHLQEDQIRFKNLMRKVEEIMGNDPDKDNDTQQAIMSRLEELHDNQDFWTNRSEAAVICVNPSMLTALDAPMDTEEYVAVDTHFHLGPLFALTSINRPYHVLLLAEQEPRVFRGDLYGLEATSVELPRDVRSALMIDEMSQRQHHYNAKSRAGGSSGQNAGSNAKDSGDEERLKFFRMIDEKIRNGLDTTLPLLLVGVTSEVAEYRSISKYQNILKEAVDGNHTKLALTELHDIVRPVIEKVLVEKAATEAAERYEELKGQERAVAEPAAVKDAAEKGRIDTLFVNNLAITSDTVRDNDYDVKRISFLDAQKNLLLDRLALVAWSQGSKIVNLDAEHMPEHSWIAATLRY